MKIKRSTASFSLSHPVVAEPGPTLHSPFMSKTIVGVMGPGDGARLQDCEHARKLGRLLAQRGWVTLCGGRQAGVMASVAAGVRMGGGTIIGLLPSDSPEEATPDLDIAIPTGMGSARNAINAVASEAVIAVGMGLGTASEVALALKARRPVVLLGVSPATQAFFRELSPRNVPMVDTPEAAVETIARLLAERA